MLKRQAAAFRSVTTGACFHVEVGETDAQGVRSGRLVSEDGIESVEISEYIPRFSAAGAVENFGIQWEQFRSTQLDSHTGVPLSRNRLYRSTGWKPEALMYERILEAGCGAGRFTEILLEGGAHVVAFDLSSAVDACYLNHTRENLLVFQGDLFEIPLEKESFDRILCFGVLQHTPDPRRAFLNLIQYLRRGGKIAIDVYLRTWKPRPYHSKYLWRPLTTRLRPAVLKRIVEWYVPRWLPVDTALRRTPVIRALTALVPCWNYTGLPLKPEQLTEWAVLDTYDALGARYDKPATLSAVEKWLREAGLVDIEVEKGGNGIIGRGTKP